MKRLFYSVLFFGWSCLVALGQQASSQEQRKTLAIIQVDLPSTTAKLLSLLPEPGMMVYNMNPNVQGSVAYPSIGRGIYTFDGAGWIANKVREIPIHRKEELEPYVSNAVVLLSEGTFRPPSASAEAGRYFYVRNTHKESPIWVANVIDFGQETPGLARLSAKEGAMMIFSDGKAWYRIQ